MTTDFQKTFDSKMLDSLKKNATNLSLKEL